MVTETERRVISRFTRIILMDEGVRESETPLGALSAEQRQQVRHLMDVLDGEAGS